jgi:hypothetical protein
MYVFEDIAEKVMMSYSVVCLKSGLEAAGGLGIDTLMIL